MPFGSLVPGMAPMPIPPMRPNGLMQQGMQMMNAARQAQRQPGSPGGQPGQPQQGLLQRLLNPAAPPVDLSAPGVPAPGGNPMQMGLLSKLFPGLAGQGAPAAGAMPPGGGMVPPVPPNALGGLY